MHFHYEWMNEWKKKEKEITHFIKTMKHESTGLSSCKLINSTRNDAVAKKTPDNQAKKRPMQGMDASFSKKEIFTSLEFSVSIDLTSLTDEEIWMLPSTEWCDESEFNCKEVIFQAKVSFSKLN